MTQTLPYHACVQGIYLDNNATTQPLDEVTDAVADAMRQQWANPSSVHRAGQQVRASVELARSQVCKLIGCRERELIFTSGATEANNLALAGLTALRSDRSVVITTAIEHAAVREPCEQLERLGATIVRLAVGPDGLVTVESLTEALAEHGDNVALVSIHWANNETGVVQPIAELAHACRDAGVPIHTDATQAAGKLPIDLRHVPVDALSLAAHKFHGPKGVGALYLSSSRRLRPQQLGGPQERQRRGGTEHTFGIIGMGIAADTAGRWLATDGPAHVRALRDRLERAVLDRVDGAMVNAAGSPRLVNTTSIAFPALEAEAILIGLSERGVYASAGAACSSGSLEPSPVLLAMKIGEAAAHGSVRFSLSRFTADSDIDRAVDAIVTTVGKLRATMPV